MYTLDVMVKTLFIDNSSQISIHLFRSIFASFSAFLFDFLILAGLVELLTLHYLAASAAGFVAGVSISYVLSVNWIFKTRSLKNKQLEYTLFLTIGAIGLGLNAVSMYILVEAFALHYLFARVIAGSAIFLFNFFTRRIVLFRQT